MRSTFLLGSLLAIVPFISATPTRSGPVLRDSPHFVTTIPLSDRKTFVVNGCHELGDLSQLNEVSLNNANSLTVKTCITACHAKNYTQCGVGNNKCYGGNSAVGGTEIGELSCKGLTCLGNGEEYCGSHTSLIRYSLPKP